MYIYLASFESSIYNLNNIINYQDSIISNLMITNTSILDKLNEIYFKYIYIYIYTIYRY